MGTNWAPWAAVLQQRGLGELGDSQAYLAEPLGVGAMLLTADDSFVFLKRSERVGEAPGKIDIPGGHPEPKAVAVGIPEESIQLKDLSEELVVNLPLHSLHKPILLGIARNNTSAGRASAEFYIRNPILFGSLLARVRHVSRTEQREEKRCLARVQKQVKLPEDQEEGLKFTGLSKEELMKVAGTPGWVRTRWALLVLFWLGWLGMLAAAIVIIVQAPRCQQVPEQSWWHKGALYRIGAVAAFMDSNGDGTGDLAGVSQRIDELNQLKIKGLVLGPVHKSIQNTDFNLDLMAIDPSLGSMENFTRLLQVAQKKSIRVVLDLTPNYKGGKPWFTETYLKTNSEKLKGVDGIQLSGVEDLLEMQPQLWEELRNLTGNYSTEERQRQALQYTP
ncbi:UNVERIFIED_CONTAM: hypothetical protein FKN15_028023 [Acipenser sinensis]